VKIEMIDLGRRPHGEKKGGGKGVVDGDLEGASFSTIQTRKNGGGECGSVKKLFSSGGCLSHKGKAKVNISNVDASEKKEVTHEQTSPR